MAARRFLGLKPHPAPAKVWPAGPSFDWYNAPAWAFLLGAKSPPLASALPAPFGKAAPFILSGISSLQASEISDMAPRKKTANGNIEARLTALRADFDALQTDLKGLYGDVGQIASERAALAMRSAEEIADRAVALAEEAAKEAKATALEYKDEAQEWADENAEELRGYVRAQPVQSLLIAGGLGVFLGAIFLRR